MLEKRGIFVLRRFFLSQNHLIHVDRVEELWYVCVIWESLATSTVLKD